MLIKHLCISTRRIAMPFEVFISYSHEDQALRDELDTHLSTLKRQQDITSWSDGDIFQVAASQQQIVHHVHTAQIILLLLSAEFIPSDFCYSVAMEHDSARLNAGPQL